MDSGQLSVVPCSNTEDEAHDITLLFPIDLLQILVSTHGGRSFAFGLFYLEKEEEDEQHIDYSIHKNSSPSLRLFMKDFSERQPMNRPCDWIFARCGTVQIEVSELIECGHWLRGLREKADIIIRKRQTRSVQWSTTKGRRDVLIILLDGISEMSFDITGHRRRTLNGKRHGIDMAWDCRHDLEQRSIWYSLVRI